MHGAGSGGGPAANASGDLSRLNPGFSATCYTTDPQLVDSMSLPERMPTHFWVDPVITSSVYATICTANAKVNATARLPGWTLLEMDES